MKSKRVVVVGAGFGGLGTAALLAKEGFNVTLLEKNDTPGGRAHVWKERGFTFDMGPSWYLMRDVFNRFYGEFGGVDTDYYNVVRLNPHYRIYFGAELVGGDGYVNISPKIEENIALFDTLEDRGGEKLASYLHICQKMYESSMEAAVYTDITSIFDFVRNPELRKSGKSLPLLENIDSYIKKYFTSDVARKILEYTIVFLGGSPQNTPALYSLMSHVDFNQGVWFPMGGMGSVVATLESLGKSQGVEYKYGVEVLGFNYVQNAISSVRTDHGEFEADYVVMNGDLVHSETSLLEPQYQTYPVKYWRNKKIAPSAFLLYLGISKKLPKLAHHTLFLQRDWMEHFNEIFDSPQWPENPSYYVNCPTKTDSSLAPSGCENIFILVPVAPNLEDTAEVREEYAKKILVDFEKTIGEEIEPHLMVRRVFSHRDFTSLYHAYQGTALGLSHTMMQSSVFRPQHRSKKLTNLLNVGQYTTPGIGTMMCLISAMHIRDILRDE